MGMQGMLEQIRAEKLSEFLQNPKLAYKHILGSIAHQGDAMLGQIMTISGMNPDEFLRSTLAGFDAHPAASAEEKVQIKEVYKKQFEKILSRLAAAQKPGPKLVKGSNKTMPEEPRKTLSLEKDWHILHYILNGTEEGGSGPLSDVVLGGSEIPDRDRVMGYGPARYLTPPQVKAVSEVLSKVDFVKLAEAFDPEDAARKRIYGLSQRPQDMLEHMVKNLSPDEAQAVRNRFSVQPEVPSMSPEEVSQFVGPVQAFYTEAAQNDRAMLLYLT